jgi:Zn-dependent protease with chaperone function
MRIAVYLPLLAALALAGASPLLARWLPPARAAVWLTVGVVAAAATSVWGLLLVAATLASQTEPVREDAYRRGVLLTDPVPDLVAVAAVVALVVGAVRAGRVIRRRYVATSEARALCAACPPVPGADAGRLVVAPLDGAHAFAVPGPPGRPGWILVTRGMLRALSGTQRRVLLAHERAHLAGRHHLLRAAVEIAAALNPLLIPTRAAVAYLVERAADERAARAVGDRRAAAKALAAAALADTTAGSTGGLLAYQSHAVPRRVAALLAAPPAERRLPALAPLVVAGLAACAALEATMDFAHLADALLPF